MKIICIGLNHKTAPIDVREKFYLNPLQQDLFLSELKSNPQIIEAFIFCTCNRIEIYAHVLDPALDTKVFLSLISQIKQAEKSGVMVRPCGKDGLRKFYDLHLRLRKNKYRLFPQPYRFFDIIWKGYMEKNAGALLGAFDSRGRFIGGTIYLICGNTLYYKFNTSALDALKERPNNILLWEGIKFAKSRGLRFVDMGSSGLEQKGLIMFKEHAGAEGSFITHLGFHPPDYKFSQKRILCVMTWLFTRPWMPNIFVRWGSSRIYPYLA